MRTLMIAAAFGLGIVTVSTPISPLLGSGGGAAAWVAGMSARFDSTGRRLSMYEARQAAREYLRQQKKASR